MESVNKTQMQEKVNNVTTSEDAAKVVQEFQQIVKNKKKRHYMVDLPSRTNISEI